MNKFLIKRRKLNKKGGIFFWIIPLVIFIVLLIILGKVKSKMAENRIGKPDIVSAKYYGKVETIHVKKGDIVKPGQEICSYTVTDIKGNSIDNNKENEDIYVTVKKIKGEKFLDSVELPGIIQPYVKCDVSAQVGGRLLKIYVDKGKNVEKGDIIAKIEKDDYEIALSQAKAAYSLAEIQYKRIKKLIKAKATSTSDQDRAEANFRNTKAVLNRAKLALKRCNIYAPITGRVNLKFFEEGEIISSGKNIVRIIDISKVKLNIGIPEQDVDNVRKLKEISFIIPSLNNKKFTGKVDHISYTMTPMAKIYPLEINIDNKNNEILPGMVAKAQVIRKVYDNAVLIPIFSVIPGGDEYFSFVYNNGKAEKRILKLGSFQAKRVHILKGLKPGDNLIDKGLRLVDDNVPVKIVK